MLPNELWHVLGLEPRVATERAAFFEAFAKLVANPPSPQPSQFAELSRFSDPRPGLEAFGEPPGADGEAQFEDIEPEPAAADRPEWERAGFEADALRQAAISTLLVDTQRGLALLAEAAGRYLAARPTFAMTLLQGATAEPIPPSRGSLAAQLVRFARGHGRQLELAKLDAYHWRKFGGHAELVDLDA